MSEKLTDLIKQGLVPVNYDEIGSEKFPLTWAKLDRLYEHPDDSYKLWRPIVIFLLACYAQLMLVLYLFL